MKNLITLMFAISIAIPSFSQSAKSKQDGKIHRKIEQKKNFNDPPANIRSSFYRDYPFASRVKWTNTNKYWTASFPDGYYHSSATYGANGQRINSASNANRSSGFKRTQSQSLDGSIWARILKNK